VTSEEALAWFEEEMKDGKCSDECPYCNAFEWAIIALKNRGVGHWIDTGSGQQCSACREIQYGYDNFRVFCAHCGAFMI